LAGYAAYQMLELPGDAAVTAAARLPGVECRGVQLDDLARFAEDPAYDFDKSFLPLAHARGDWCMGVFAGAKLVSYSLNSALPTEFHSSLRYHFPEGWIYHFKAFTVPEWRGKRLHALNVAAVLARCHSHPGFKGLVTLVLDTNLPSLASFQRLGFRPTQRFVVLRRESDHPWVLKGVEAGENRVERVTQEERREPWIRN
jgi:hypothetical protein